MVGSTKSDHELYKRIAWAVSIGVALVFFLIVVLKTVAFELPFTTDYFDLTAITELGLNEWGDFLAGVGGTLALVWVITSTVLQSAELADQRKELVNQNKELGHQTEALLKVRSAMDAQAAALREQADILQETKRSNIEDQAWRDIKELLEAIRERIPVNDDFYFWTLSNTGGTEGDKCTISFCYQTDNSEDLEKVSDITFLFRAGGGLRNAMKLYKSKVSEGYSVVESRSGEKRFQELKQLFSHVEALSKEVSLHCKKLVEACRVSEWNALLDTAIEASDKKRKRRTLVS
ncbi:hypothetical protein [Shimia sp. R9_3]|uniref:hypothetical protein n=1 Tax=Shimia sp. R9_3 TaxID=2821113 RepID=UPI001ADA3D5E|nr:hypothetical protein [Shimia sp. R9_3]MBO9401938.1 hypothetical protein [Shimia sp. R9_3]